MPEFNKMNRSPDVNDSNSSGDIESKEKLNMPVYVIYRDNTLYQTLIPKIVENMEKIGKKVIQHTFPAGTSEEEIKKYFEDEKVKESLKNAELLNDYTCYHNLPGGYKFYDENQTKNSLGILDDLSKKIMQDSLLGEKIIEGMKEGSGIEEVPSELSVLHNIIKEVFAKNGEPENLYIVEKYISSHGFNNNLLRWTKSNILEKKFEEKYGEEYKKLSSENKWNDAEEMKKQAEISIVSSLDDTGFLEIIESNDEFKKTLDLGFEKDKLISVIKQVLKEEITQSDALNMWNSFIADKMKDSLKDVIDEKKITIVPDMQNVESGDKNYVIVDRHACREGEEKTKLTFPLPLDSMIDYVVKNNLLDINFDTDEAISKAVDKAFKK